MRFLILFCGVFTSALVLAKQPTAVHFTLARPYAQRNSKVVTAFLKNNLPRDKVVEIEINPEVLLGDGAAAREELFNNLSHKLEIGDLITHLVIDSPAKRIRRAPKREGNVNDFFEVIAPLLREQTSSQLAIVINGSRGLKGSDLEVTGKVRRMLNVLGATNGTLFAMYNQDAPVFDDITERELSFPERQSWGSIITALKLSGYTLQNVLPKRHQLLDTATLGTLIGLYASQDPGALEPAVAGTAVGIAFFMVGNFAAVLANSVGISAADKFAWVNQGRFFTFRQGTITSSEKRNKYSDVRSIYGIEGCRAALDAIDHVGGT